MDNFLRAHNHKKHRNQSDPFLTNRKDIKNQLKRMLQGLQTDDNEIKNAVSKPFEVYSSSDSYSDFEDSELDVNNGLVKKEGKLSVSDASNNTDISEMKEGMLVNSMSDESNESIVVDAVLNDHLIINTYEKSSSDCTSITCDDESDSDSIEEFDHDKNLAIKIIQKLTRERVPHSNLKKSKSKKKKISQNNNYNMFKSQEIECAEIQFENERVYKSELVENVPEPELEENVSEPELMEDVPESPQELEQMESEPELEYAAEIDVIENAAEVEVIENAPELVEIQNVPRGPLNFDTADPKVHTNGRGPRKIPHDYVSILVNNHPYLPLADIIGNYKHSTCKNIPSYPGKGYFRKVKNFIKSQNCDIWYS